MCTTIDLLSIGRFTGTPSHKACLIIGLHIVTHSSVFPDNHYSINLQALSTIEGSQLHSLSGLCKDIAVVAH